MPNYRGKTKNSPGRRLPKTPLGGSALFEDLADERPFRVSVSFSVRFVLLGKALLELGVIRGCLGTPA